MSSPSTLTVRPSPASGVYRKAEFRWFTSDGQEHATRAEAHRHERTLVLRRILAPFVQADGTIQLANAERALLDSPVISISYPIGAPK